MSLSLYLPSFDLSNNQWRIMIRKSGIAERYTEQQCTVPLDLTSGLRFVATSKIWRGTCYHVTKHSQESRRANYDLYSNVSETFSFSIIRELGTWQTVFSYMLRIIRCLLRKWMPIVQNTCTYIHNRRILQIITGSTDVFIQHAVIHNTIRLAR
jgi:hypothetical protein